MPLPSCKRSLISGSSEDLEMYAEAVGHNKEKNSHFNLPEHLQRYMKNCWFYWEKFTTSKVIPLKNQHMESVLDLMPTEPDAWLTMAVG